MEVLFYEGVPFDTQYKDVLKTNSLIDLYNFLQPYYVGTFENTNIFVDEEIQATPQYENCNYCIVEDENEETPAQYNHKCYFITGYKRKSKNCTVYDLKLDVWNTYQLSLIFDNSLIIGGHKEDYTLSNYQTNIEPLSSTNEGTKSYFINPIVNNTFYTSIYISFTSEDLTPGTTYPFHSLISVAENLGDLIFRLQWLSSVKEISLDGEHFKACRINTINIIPNYNDTYYTSDGVSHLITLKSTSDTTANQLFRILKADYEIKTTESSRIINSINMTLEPGYIYRIGNSTNYTDIQAYGQTITFKLCRYIDESGTFKFYLTYNDCFIDYTFMTTIPVYTSNFADWYTQNMATIEQTNKNSQMNLGFKIAGGTITTLASLLSQNYVVGAMGVMSTAGAMASYFGEQKAIQTQINSAKQKIQSVNNATMYASFFLFAEGLFINKINPLNLDDIQSDINYYGYTFTTYATPNITKDSTIYNFYFFKINNPNLKASCNQTNIDMLKDIFERGVRIWYNKANYKKDCNYLIE